MNISRLSLICAAIAADATALSNEGISHPSSTASTRNLQNGGNERAYYCACESCTQEIWESIAMDADGNCESCTCGSRIIYLQTSKGFDAAGACSKVSDEYIDGPCGPVCDPTKCEGGLTSQFLNMFSDPFQNKPATSPNIDPSNKLVNIALGKVSTASSQVGSSAHAFDGNPTTRWESDHGIDNGWLQVDLGAMYKISKVGIFWENASAKSYDIQVSTDGSLWTSVWSKRDGYEGMDVVDSVFGVVTGRYVRMQAYERATVWGYSIWEMTVLAENLDSGTFLPSQSSPSLSDPVNIAYGKVSTASNQFQSSVYAFDGSPMTRWESVHGIDNAWLQVDLGAMYQLSTVGIYWETACAKSYDIQVSTDGSFFSTVWSKRDGFEGMGVVESVFGLVTGRYVRMQAYKRATMWGYSIWEMTVLVENLDSSTFAPSQSSPSMSNSFNIAYGKVSTASSQFQSTAYAFDGTPVTRWESVHGIDDVWLQVDLGVMYQLNKVNVHWEFASAKSYDIQVSADGSSFSTVWSKKDGVEGMGVVESVFGAVNARYVRLQAYERATDNGYSVWEMEVFGLSDTFAQTQSSPSISEPINIAFGKVATTSNNEQSQSFVYEAAYAFDGNPISRWSSNHGIDDVWLQVDLGATYQLNKVVVNWETASAKSYDIQVSTDDSSFSTVWSKTDGFQGMGTVESVLGSVTGRYVRMQAYERTTIWGYSIWEMEVFEQSTSSPKPSTKPTAALPKTSTSAVNPVHNAVEPTKNPSRSSTRDHTIVISRGQNEVNVVVVSLSMLLLIGLLLVAVLIFKFSNRTMTIDRGEEKPSERELIFA